MPEHTESIMPARQHRVRNSIDQVFHLLKILNEKYFARILDIEARNRANNFFRTQIKTIFQKISTQDSKSAVEFLKEVEATTNNPGGGRYYAHIMVLLDWVNDRVFSEETLNPLLGEVERRRKEARQAG